MAEAKLHYLKKTLRHGAWDVHSACGRGKFLTESLDATTCKRCRKSPAWKSTRLSKLIFLPFYKKKMDPALVKMVKEAPEVVHLLDVTKTGVKSAECGATVPLDDLKVPFRNPSALELITCPACYEKLDTELKELEKRLAADDKMRLAAGKARIEAMRKRS